MSETWSQDVLRKVRISPGLSIKEALKRIDEVGLAILFVCEENGTLIGSLTDGDIRRSILKGASLKESISVCFNPRPVFVKDKDYSRDSVKKLMLEKVIEVVPVIDKNRILVDVLSWSEILGDKFSRYKQIDVPVVIMAGGEGKRLGPFTKILPKPLIPIGEKPIIEIIMDRFFQYGVRRFYLTLNYKGEMIKTYFEHTEIPYSVEYIHEKDFLGTVGSLKLLKGKIKGSFIVSNCDILVDADYSDALRLHCQQNNCLTIVGSIRHHRIPYGVIHFKDGGVIDHIQEKPEYDFTVNTGVYIVSDLILKFIPDNIVFDMPELINSLLRNKERVGVYPVSEKSYIDVGQWEEYKKAWSNVNIPNSDV